MNGNAHRSLLIVRIVLGLIPLAAGLYVIGIGQDTNWDLRNYHFYNPFAYLTGRMGYDVAVSHVATYYNPLLYIPFYYAVTGLPPKVVGFILGFIPGFNILLLYAIARRVIFSSSTGTSGRSSRIGLGSSFIIEYTRACS